VDGEAGILLKTKVHTTETNLKPLYKLVEVDCLMPRQAPLEVRTHAFKLFSQGMTVSKIVSGLGKKFPNEPVSAPTIYSWKRRYNWAERKNNVEEKALAKVEESQASRIAKDDIEQRKIYDRITKKAIDELENLTFQRPGDAVKAVDIGIQGSRGIARGLVNISFVEEVLDILSEEIHDEDTRIRLSIRLGALMQKTPDGD